MCGYMRHGGHTMKFIKYEFTYFLVSFYRWSTVVIHIVLGYTLNLKAPGNGDIKFAKSDPYEKNTKICSLK